MRAFLTRPTPHPAPHSAAAPSLTRALHSPCPRLPSVRAEILDEANQAFLANEFAKAYDLWSSILEFGEAER